MTKAEIIKTFRGFVEQRKRAFDAASRKGIIVCQDKWQAIRHLEFYMPDNTWELKRILRYIINNRSFIDTIMPHTSRAQKNRKHMIRFLTECEHLNFLIS